MLITEFAYFFLLFSLVLSLLQIIIPSYGVFADKPQLQNLARPFAYAQFFAVFLSFLGLMTGFYFNDFSLVYIAKHSNSLLPWYYKISATWSGHEGSLLLWVMILSGWGALVARQLKRKKNVTSARVLCIFASIQFMMLAMLIFSSSPFERSMANGMLTLPVDGADLNPLLQDFGLIVHPPLLYLGYVGMAVPFVFCISALWEGELNSAWARLVRPWVLSAWGFLTLGIALGSWWAYYELGWGGWWFWDPVENASLLPWLVCTALIHSLVATEKRGVFKAWTIMLAIFAFALSLLGTFLVRSGVISSVHSFASDPTRGMLILLILAVTIGFALLLFAIRGWKLTTENTHELRSRETLLIINNIIILIATLVVLLGTLYPIIADALHWGQISVGAPYFNALFVPLSWLLLLVMGAGVVTRWRRDKRPLLGISVAIGMSAMVMAGLAMFFAKPNSLLNVGLTLALCLWVLGWSIYDLKDKWRKQVLTISYLGMHLAHLGLLIVAIGIAITSSQSIEKDVALGIGEMIEVKGYTFTMKDIYEVKGKNYDAIASDILVNKVDANNSKKIANLYPEKRTYVVSMMPMTETSIDANLWRDVYVALGEPIETEKTTINKNAQWAVRIYIKPFVRWIWFGALVMAVGALLCVLDRSYYRKRT